MSNLAVQKYESASVHPRCPACAVAMWLVKIERHVSGDRQLARHHYECMACDALAILPPLQD
jgi:transposase-like protein